MLRAAEWSQLKPTVCRPAFQNSSDVHHQADSAIPGNGAIWHTALEESSGGHDDRHPTDFHQYEGGPVVSQKRKVLQKCLTFLFSHIGLTLLVFVYMIAGAFIFVEIEYGQWETAQLEKLNETQPQLEVKDPDYTTYAAVSITQWRASWMDDKVLRFWNGSHKISETYPDDWTRERVREIRLWEVQLNQKVLESVAKYAAELATNKTRRDMEVMHIKQEAPKWEFASAFLYSLSLVTTIGYGHIYPCTIKGKMVTIVYAIIGIPILLAFLANIGGFLAQCIRMLFDHLVLMKLCRKVYRKHTHSQPSSAANSPMPVRNAKFSVSSGAGASPKIASSRSRPSTTSVSDSPALNRALGKPPVSKVSHSPTPSPRMQQYRPTLVVQDDGKTAEVRSASLQPYEYTSAEMAMIADAQEAEKSVPVLMCVAIMAGYLCLGSVVFMALENWQFHDGLYFCFITLSTIGLGDLVPGDSLLKSDLHTGKGKGTMIGVCFYILIGLALLASCFNLLHDSARSGIRVIGKKLGIVKPKKPASRRQSNATVV